MLLLLSFPLNPRLRSLAFVVHGSLTSDVPKTSQRIRNRLGNFASKNMSEKHRNALGLVVGKKNHGNSEIQGRSNFLPLKLLKKYSVGSHSHTLRVHCGIKKCIASGTSGMFLLASHNWICPGNQDPCQRPKTKSSKHALEVERWSTQYRCTSLISAYLNTTISGKMALNINTQIWQLGPVLSAWHWYAILSEHAQLRHRDCYPSAHRCSWWAVQQPLAKVMGLIHGDFLTNKKTDHKEKTCTKTVQGQTSESSSAIFFTQNNGKAFSSLGFSGGCRPSNFSANGPPVNNPASVPRTLAPWSPLNKGRSYQPKQRNVLLGANCN